MGARLPLATLIVASLAGCSLIIDTSGLSGGEEPREADGAAAVDAPSRAEAGADVTAPPPPLCAPTVDLTSDAKNCGKCGHDCLGGECSGARCQPVVMVSGQSGAVGVATDGNELFWSTVPGYLRAQRLDGMGPVREIAKLMSALHIEVDDTYVYVADRVEKRIVRVPKSGATPVEKVASCIGDCLGVAVFAGTVYFTDRGPNALRVVGSDGGVASIASGFANPEDAFATATEVYVANENANAVVKVPLDGTPSSLFFPVTDPVSVAIEGTDMFVVSQNAGTIYRRPVAGGGLEAVATGQNSPAGLLVTKSVIIWANIDGNTIMRLAR